MPAYQCSLYGLYLGGSKFYLSLLLRCLWQSTSDSSKHLVFIVHQDHDSFCVLYSLPRGSKVLIVSVSMVLRLRLIMDAPCISD